jgi:hypothetical protein
MLSRLASVSKTTASRGVCAAMQGRSSLSTDIRGRWPQGVDAKGKVRERPLSIVRGPFFGSCLTWD